jgi:cobalamin biosynthesis protein CobD/CbiB
MNTSKLIAHLNSINVGEMDGIRSKLVEARQACIALNQQELAAKLEEAEEALEKADLKTYRKRLETVVARLGHLR